MTIPVLLTAGAAILGGYFLWMSRYADRTRQPEQRWRLLWFGLGLIVALAAFVPSSSWFGAQYRFTANMLQFMLLSSIAPPLLWLGMPPPVMDLFARQRRLHFAAKPLYAFFGATALFLVWHLPVPFQVSSSNLPLWLLKQFTFLIAGLWAWLPVMGPLRVWGTLGFPAKILYIFFLAVPTTILGALFAFAPNLIYGASALAFEICAPASIGDQQVGGLLMWNGCAAIDFAVFAFFFFKWHRTWDASEQQHL